MLVVISIIGLAVAVAVPLISDAVRAAQIRTATDEFMISLMAARMLAVTRQTPVDVTVVLDPANYYEYPDRRGDLRRYEMPEGVRIVSATNPITFLPNGMVVGGAQARIEATLRGGVTEVWEVETSILGVSTIDRRSDP